MNVDLALPARPGEALHPAPFHWLENPRYRLLVTAAGGGFSMFDEYLLGDWRADPVEGHSGLLVFVRDLDTDLFWTASGRPAPGQWGGGIVREPTGIVIARVHEGLSSRVDIRLHGSAGIEQRACTLSNSSSKARHLELTSFIAVALNHPAAHEGHPAFSKLFVQTAPLGDRPILMATRRPRGHGETAPVLMHALLDAPVTDFLTDRACFIGRGRDLSAPQALANTMPLSRKYGNVLDPALSLRTVLRLDPGTSCTVRFILAAGEDADGLFRQIEAVGNATLEALIAPGSAAPRASAPLARDNRGETLHRLSAGLEPLADLRVQPRIDCPPARGGSREGPDQPLQFFNGYGGFSEDGHEYVMRLKTEAGPHLTLPPAPWINVIANPTFGCLISERGAGAVWSQNSREYRLTPWSNDPVMDPHGDALYVRDEDTGAFWSPMPGPAAPQADFEVRHGLGYSAWHCDVEALAHEVTLFVPEVESLRVTRVQIRNSGSRRRRLALYAYNRWVLGSTPEATRSNLRTEFSPAVQAVLARHRVPPEGPTSIAFAAADRVPLDGWCVDRAVFLGVPGSTAAPAALVGDGSLSEVCGTDPCAVLRAVLDIAPGMTGEVTFFLGDVRCESDLERLLELFRRPGHVGSALRRARAVWSHVVSRLQVTTPSAALNLMVNGWLAYQNISCRMWARSAFYQSGGAFGFRDQIQDAASIIYLRPDLTRAQILLHAGHQFIEGDVLHWWHPPHDRGIRTRFADDLLWLPWVTAYYVNVTGDRDLLAQKVRYLEADPLLAEEAEALVRARASSQSGDLYEHCCRALDRSMARGAHGLPLFGAGDWNDGMNRVGHEGRGESVWMGFFLVTVLEDFLALCEHRGDGARADRYRKHCAELRSALNAEGWDGAWYRRGWYDNGTVLGSQSSDECRIDALVQAWAVISKAAPAQRVELALDALDQHLIDDDERLIRLLTPPFVDTPHDPGYIKGYVAGVRENGGQYTHAAVWVVKAMAEAGRRDRAAQLLEGLLPINHSLDRAAAEKYKVEPYVVAADVYGAEPHIGRGGWTWYTGSAGWMYRVAVETILGFRLEDGRTLCLRPRIPDTWPGVRIDYAVDEQTHICIELRNPEKCAARIVNAQFDGVEWDIEEGGAVRIPVRRTGRVYHLTVLLGA